VIEAVIERCAGIDVGKKFVLVCVMAGGAKDEPWTQIKKFGTIVSELDRLAAWLVAEVSPDRSAISYAVANSDTSAIS
jgi:transposase